MRLFWGIASVCLMIYSIAIIITEWNTSQDYIRQFLGDISGDVDLYLINTTMSVGLLWATALMLVAAFRCAPEGNGQTQFRSFAISQAAIFAYLGFDDRFQFHEKLAFHLGNIPDHYILLVVAALQFALLIRFTDIRFWLSMPGKLFIAGGVLAGFMLAVDALAPHELVFRLSIEDLSKTWAAWFFFLFAWALFEQQVASLRKAIPT